MPLIQSSSKEALQKNIATEIEAGKDPKQASAIAYSIQKKNDGYDVFGITFVNKSNSYEIWKTYATSKEEAVKNFENKFMRMGYNKNDIITVKQLNTHDASERYVIVNKRGKIIRYANSLEEARHFISSYTKAGEYGNLIKELNSGRIVDMKNFKVTYDNREFIVKAKDKKDAAEKVMHKVIDEGELVSKYEKEVNGIPVTSAIIKHKKGFSFISGIIREDRDFNDLESAKAYAQRLGYITLNDSKIKDKRIPAKLKAELLAKTEEFIDTYNIRGFVKIDIVKNMITIEAEIGYNMLDKLMNDLTTVLNKYGHGATFDLDSNGKATAILRDAKLKMNDTLEILQKDNYKLILDGSWLEIVTTSGETIYSGNTTARTVREAYDMAKKQHIVDSNITSYKVNYRGRTFLVDAVSKEEAAKKILKNIK